MRLVRFDEAGVTFRYKDYRRDGPERHRVVTLSANEFIRRFLLHVLPCGFYRIRHYGLLAGSSRKASLALVRQLLGLCCKNLREPQRGGRGLSRGSRRLRIEMLVEQLGYFGEGAWSNTESAFDHARFATNIARETLNMAACPLRRARITSKPLIVA